jgi:hypothetical protein
VDCFEQSEEQLVTEILHHLKGHPEFVIANRIVAELQQRQKQIVTELVQQSATQFIN